MSRPKSIEEYRVWAESELEQSFEAKYETWYRAATSNLSVALGEHEFVTGLEGALTLAAAKYTAATGSSLFVSMVESPLRPLVKPYDSVIDKLFRHNVNWNRQFPKPPKDGWLDLLHCFVFDDIFRMKLVCKYLDGPSAVVDALASLALTTNVEVRHDTRELDAGYYAYHVYVKFMLPLLGIDFGTEVSPIQLEIQITTQLQDALQELTHRFYERSRLEHEPDRKAWKWDHASSQFRAAYLGHTLHLLEGVVLDVRNGSMV